ncbi:MAG: CYTH domain-containing protein [Muribaculaceae bacterium]|nr:CYTH domain-containing protein [Muribaculaceae bacterium]
MSKEIERKFLVKDDSFMDMATEKRHLSQGYLCTDPDATVRVRTADGRAWLTVKGRNAGAVRDEWEYAIPAADAEEMLGRCCARRIDKTRYIVSSGGRTWEVDVFGGRLAGLIVAEVELDSADAAVELPPFVGREVTDDARYYNSALSDPSAPVPPAC